MARDDELEIFPLCRTELRLALVAAHHVLEGDEIGRLAGATALAPIDPAFGYPRFSYPYPELA